MSVMKKVYETIRPEETFLTGKELGKTAAAGEVYALVGDLGVGKTVFTKGFAEGLGIDEPVNSPTFTILQIYEDGRIPLYHFDVYRIEAPEEMPRMYGSHTGLRKMLWNTPPHKASDAPARTLITTRGMRSCHNVT